MSAPELPVAGISPPRDGDEWRILGHTYWLRSWSDSCFMFETSDPAGTGIPAHVHPDQDEFIYVIEGDVDVELDGTRHRAHAGDIARLPRGVPHGYFSVGETASRMIFAVTPAGQLKELFDALHDLEDLDEVFALSSAHNVQFLPAATSEA
jgi:mannose-6-phosphate isomerase-like protein (cupin superfamily)